MRGGGPEVHEYRAYRVMDAGQGGRVRSLVVTPPGMHVAGRGVES